jgi:glycosyltransferase involved in cell wall biosynthesis
MRILIVSQYFWPENFKINDIALALKERGHEVSVITGKPNYPSGKFSEGYTFFNKRMENWNRIKIYRTLLLPRGNSSGIKLFLNYFSFAFFASIRILFINDKFDKIFVYEPSPITVGLPGIIARYKFKAPMYFWVQDLWPESISSAGGINNKLILNIFDWITRVIYNQSFKILVQSKAFIPYITNQKVVNNKLIYYPNSTESFFKNQKCDIKLFDLLPKGFKIIFAGNIGEAQSFDTLLKAAELLKNENNEVQWLILGEGRMKSYVQQKINEIGLNDNFHLLGSYPSYDMPGYFSCADALLVSLKNDPIFSLTIPSKIQSYMACGKPIIASLDGEGARIIREANAGFTSNSEDPLGLKDSIKKILSLSLEERLSLGKNARNYFEREFEREMLVDKLEIILSK